MKKPRVTIENLALELTRKCNLQCGHCMRGNAENKEMSDETLDRIFEEISAVGLLNFVGGESSLAVDRIIQLIATVKKHRTLIKHVLVFTNAVNITDEYIEILKELQNIADEDYNDRVGFLPRYDKEGKYPLKIIVSLDKYHLQSMEELGISKSQVKANIERLAQLFPVEIDKMCNYTIYDEGRGADLRDTYKSPTPMQKYCSVYRDYDNLFLIGPMVAISYDGRIVEANRSYDFNDRHGVGNINEESIISMFSKLKKTRGIKSCKDINTVYDYMHKYLHVYSSTTKEIQNMLRYNKRKKKKVDLSYFKEDIPNISELSTETSEVTPEL